MQFTFEPIIVKNQKTSKTSH